jgi:hypothetical protein
MLRVVGSWNVSSGMEIGLQTCISNRSIVDTLFCHMTNPIFCHYMLDECSRPIPNIRVSQHMEPIEVVRVMLTKASSLAKQLRRAL